MFVPVAVADTQLAIFNVKTYGAVGDGVTNDTAAVQAAATAAGAAHGCLYIPAGNYKCTAAIVVANVLKILGEGGGSADHLLSAPSRLTFTTTNTDGLRITAGGCTLEDFAVINSSGAAAAGSIGIHVTQGSYMHFNRVGVRGFYDGVAIDVGIYYTIEACYVLTCVRYGIRIQNTSVADAGDGFIGSGTTLYPSTGGAAAAIRWESGGGLKVEGVKINANGAGMWTAGVDASIVDGAATSVLLIEGNSIEGCATYGVSVTQQGTTGVFGKVIVSGNEFGPSGSMTNPINVVSTTQGDINDVIITGNYVSGTVLGILVDGVDNFVIAANDITGAFSDSGIGVHACVGGVVGTNYHTGQWTNAAVNIKSSATPSSGIAVEHQVVNSSSSTQTLVLDSSAAVASHLVRRRFLYDDCREIPGGLDAVTYVVMYQLTLPANIGAGGVLEFSVVGQVTGGVGGDAFAIYGKYVVTLPQAAGASCALTNTGVDTIAGTIVDYQLDTSVAAAVKLSIRLNAAQGGTTITGQVRVKYDGSLQRLIRI